MELRIITDKEQSANLRYIFNLLGKEPKEYPSKYDKNEVRFYIKLKDDMVAEFTEKLKALQGNFLEFKN